MEELIFRKGFIIDGNLVKCLLILKDGSEVIGNANVDDIVEGERLSYEDALKTVNLLSLHSG